MRAVVVTLTEPCISNLDRKPGEPEAASDHFDMVAQALQPHRAATSHWLTAAVVTPNTSAISVPDRPCSCSARARKRRYSFQSCGVWSMNNARTR